jgi:hypothetical protein
MIIGTSMFSTNGLLRINKSYFTIRAKYSNSILGQLGSSIKVI